MATHELFQLTLVSNDLGCFSGARGLRASHGREVTGGDEANVSVSKFRAVNTLIGNAKMAVTGRYRSVKFAKYSYRKRVDVQFRFNRRHDLHSILGSLLGTLVPARRLP